MKRSAIEALVIGFLIAILVAVAHATGRLTPIEIKAVGWITSPATATRTIGNLGQYGLILFGSLAIAYLTIASSRRGRVGILVLALVIELLVAAWICALYHVFFQPLPVMATLALAYGTAFGYGAISQRTRAFTARSLFAERLSAEQLHRVIVGDIPFEAEPKTCEATVVVCDVANKYDLAEECQPAEFAQITQTFIHRATELFLAAGGYIQAADGEGVVALFGFPEADNHHGDKAVRIALGLLDRFRDIRQSKNGESAPKCDVHLGVSSGTMIVAPLQDGDRPHLLTSGEPVELARRFCVANRFYGSRILIGPRTFELASRYIVARPIDFLSGVNTRERHEIYEPLWLAAEAKPEQLARRDSFWNGVVLYREKRWAEAYMEFQKARDPQLQEEDAPLQLYLRRLEPLALHLTAEAHEG
jgi:adenylate cyclase